MNLKLNNEARRSVSLLPEKKLVSSVKEERRRTGRYIAILVGICLFLLAIYHAWVRRIPIVASLVVPALIMFVYVGWVLFTASRDKHRLQDAEAALRALHAGEGADNENSIPDLTNSIEISVISSKGSSKANSPVTTHREWADIPSALRKGETKATNNTQDRNLIKPVILVNDKLPEEDLNQKWTDIVETLVTNEKFKAFQTRRKFKRKFCRSKRHAVFKRSYSIA